MSEISTAVARQQERREVATVTSMLSSQRIVTEIQRAVPRGMSGDRMARIALTLVRQSDMAKAKSGGKSRSLSECNVESFVASLLTASALGLEPGVNGEAYLVPYGTEATLIVGYQGMLKLAWQHPMIAKIGSGYVTAADEFDWEEGLDTRLRHKPSLDHRLDKPIAFYAFAELRTGARAVQVLSPAQVAALRSVDVKEVIEPPRVNRGNKIADGEHWMSRKTCLRQLLKPLPKSVAAAWAHQVDEQPGTKLAMKKMPEAIAATVDQPQLAAAPDDREQGQQQAETLDGPAFDPDQGQQTTDVPDPWAKPEDQS